MPNDPLRPLFRRQRLSVRVLEWLAVLLGVIALAIMIVTAMISLYPLAFISLFLIAGIVFLVRFTAGLRKRFAKDEEAARFLYAHRPPLQAKLYTRQTMGNDGSVVMIECAQARYAAAVMLPKYDYPRSPVTEIVCYEDPDRDRLLIKLGGKFHIATRYTLRTFKAQAARFVTMMWGLIWLLGLTFAGLMGWMLSMADETQQSIDCAIAAQSWTEVPATITHSDIERKVRSTKSGHYTEWINHISYDYRYGTAMHTSKQIACTYYPSRQESYAQTLRQQFPVGHRTSAWVDPQEPTRAVLLSYPTEPFERRRNGMLIASGVMVLVGLFTGALIYWLLLKRNRRLLREIEMEVWQSRTL